MLPKWLQSGIPFSGRVSDFIKFIIVVPIAGLARLFRPR